MKRAGIPPAPAKRRVSNEGPAPSRDEALRTIVREVGLRATPGRIAVLRELEKLSSPISHGELVERLGRAELDKVTVWRVLVALTKAGLVDRSDLGDRTYRFERRRASHGGVMHPHFMCITCNTVQCLPEDSVRVAPRLGRNVVEVQLKGRCSKCA